LSGSAFCQFWEQARLRDGVDVVGEGERDDVGLEAVDHGARLLARAAVRLLELDVLAGLRLPFAANAGLIAW
jgi:hypothetical protein